MPKQIQTKKPTSAQHLWEAVIARLGVTFTDSVMGPWVKTAYMENLTENSVEIVCSSEHAKTMLIKTCGTVLQDYVNEVCDGKYTVLYKIGKLRPKSKTKIEKKAPLFETSSATLKDSGLFPKYTFDTFVEGGSNLLAYSMALAITKSPGTLYNPFFLHSNVGLGKTHLMQAIGNELLKTQPRLKVIYTTGETFTNELIEAIRLGKGTQRFRDKFRKIDVLLLDDIQFIIGKEATQEEFFHTFNTLYNAQKQIVITSDKPPKEFKTLEPRLRSRFGSGVIVEILPPDTETRIAILREKRELNKDTVPDEVINVIAQRIQTNIRELEGAYIQVVTRAKALKEEVTLEKALYVLDQTFGKEERKRPLNLNQVLNAVCKYYSVTSTELKGSRRTKNLVLPRQVAMYLLKELTDTPYITIGEFLGGRDHTTIMHGTRKIEGEIGKNLELEQDIKNVTQLVNA